MTAQRAAAQACGRPPGPPAVIVTTWSSALSEKMVLSRMAMVSTGRSCGSTISKKMRPRPAPSTWAASSVSCGSAASAPMKVSMKYGAQCHTSTRTRAVMASAGSASTGAPLHPGSNALSSASTAPNSGFSMKRQEIPIRAGDMANGITSSVRALTCSRPSPASSMARPSATAIVSATEGTVNTSVTQALSRKTGSCQSRSA